MQGTGRYRPIGLVGSGSQGEVLCARDQLHDRLVALKVRRLGPADEPAELLAEARTLLELRPHQGLPLVREDFFVGDRYHLVMDWIQGIDLAHLLADAGPDGLPYPEVLRLLAQVAQALDHMHAHRPPVVHNDVKPANIVVEGSGRAVLVDFGLSGLPRHRGAPAGTSGFQAPEVCAGEAPTPSSDIFSLAATAYFALTGASPEPGATPRWRGVPEAVIPRVETALARGLAIDPSRRPHSALALVELLTPRSVPNNLPAPLTRFVGRERELAELARALGGTRLLTLTGAGGVGKTRLAVELAKETSWAYPDGVWAVELAPLAEPGLVVAAVARGLGVREESAPDLVSALCDRLRERQLLLLLDNCEHLLDAAAEIAEAILRSAPGVRILATSREPLDVFGERACRVPSLTIPGPAAVSAEDLSGYGSVALFCDRASFADPAFSLNGRTGGAVASICSTLDGIPLAIEMAAARLREASVHEVADSLTGSLQLTGARTAPSRQRTLAATVAWSYQLLSPPAACLFRRLSILAGTFDRGGVEAVCTGGGLDAEEIPGLLKKLVDCSMVVAPDLREACRGDTRYRLLETLRRYGAERLAEAGETDMLAERHLDWFLRFAEVGGDHLFGPSEGRVLARFEHEIDNFRAALARAIDQRQPELALRLTRALSRFWNVRGYWSEGRRWLEAVLAAAPDSAGADRAKALVAAAVLAENQGDFTMATRLAEEGLRSARQQGDLATAAEALNSLSNVAQAQGDQERSERLLEQCLDAWRASGTVRGVVSSFAGALGALGWRAARRAEYAKARQLFEEALIAAGELQIGRAKVNSLLGLATVAEAERELKEARSYVDQARLISRQLADKRFLGLVLYLDGLIALGEDDDEEASSQFAAATDEAVAAGDSVLFLRALEGMARVACIRKEAVFAATLFGAAARAREALPWPVSPADQHWYTVAVATAREDAGDRAFDEAWSRGRGMTTEDASLLVRQETRSPNSSGAA